MSVKKVNIAVVEIFIYVLLLFILSLTSINIDAYLNRPPTKVLGVDTQNKNGLFWQDFLDKNPDYIPGWIETGDMNRVNDINPNYLKP